MTIGLAPTSLRRSLAALTVVAAAYLAILLTRYFYPPHIPRYRLESAFMIFVVIGVACVCARAAVTRAATESAGFSRAHLFAIAGAFGAVGFALYAPALRVGLLSDDFVLADWAGRREWVHDAETGFVRPIVPLAWAILLLVPGPFGGTLHAVNLTLHALNATLVAVLATHIGTTRAAALAAGLLFLTFPAFTEAVVWASGMQDVLMTTLALVAVVALRGQIGVRLGSDPNLTPAVAVFATALALGVKETAIVIPILGWLVRWTAGPLSGGRDARVRRRELWTLTAMTALAAAYVVYRVASGIPAAYAQPVSRYFLKQLIVEPFAALGAPWSASSMSAHPLSALIRSLLVVGLLTVAFVSWSRWSDAFSRAGGSAAWVLLAALPVYSFFYVDSTLAGSRYIYLPAIGFCMLLAVLAQTASTGSRWQLTVFASAILLLVVPSAAGVRRELGRWSEAARVRDEILTALESQPVSRCGSFTTDGLADNVDGAYVFRNGLEQALAARRQPESTHGRPPVTCTVGMVDGRWIVRFE